MSSSQSKDLDQDEELIGYVHNLSHVHKSGKVSYTTCQLQTSSTATVKAICFSPDKAKPLKSAMETKSPIKLRKYQFNERFNNIVVNKNTVIQNYTKSLDFKPSETLQTQLITINSINSISPQQLVSVKAKVTQLTGPKTHRTEKATLQKSSAVLVDPTGYIRVVFWEEWVKSVQENAIYIFKNLRVTEDNYTKEKYVNTAKEGFDVEESPPFTDTLPDAQPLLLDLATKTTTVSVISFKSASSYFICNACSKKLQSDGKYMKCETCKLKQKPDQDKTQWFARVFVKDHSNQNKSFISLFHPHIVKIFNSMGKKLLPSTTEDDITDVLLDAEHIKIKQSIDGNIIDIVTD